MSDEDPEVAADLKLRARTEHDRSRTGEVKWAPPKIHSKVPCRGRCGRTVEWTEDAQERFEIFNRELRRRVEPQLDITQIAFCNPCRDEGAKLAAANNRKTVDRVAEVIRELKAGCSADKERELLLKLEKAGHPDIAGLKQWLTESKNKGNKRVAKGAL